MPIKLKTVGEYRNAIKQLRVYADGFEATDGYDLRYLRGDIYHPDKDDYRHYINPLKEHQKKKIERFFDVLQRHHGYKGTSYQTFDNEKDLHSAQRAMGMPTWKGWRGVFVPEPDDSTPATLVKVEKPGRGKKRAQWLIEYQRQGVDTIFVPFDKIQFATHGVSYVRGLFKDAPLNYKYNIDMGYGRNRWKTGGTLEQVLRELDFFVNSYTLESGKNDFQEFIMGLHVYRASWNEFNKLKQAHAKTMSEKRNEQEKFREKIKEERRKLYGFEEDKAAARRMVKRKLMSKKDYRKYYGEPF